METNEGQIKRIVLKRMGRCRVCHRAYAAEDVSVVSRQPDMWMMLVTCEDCHAKNFVAAVLNEGDPAQAELALRRLSTEAEQASQQPESYPLVSSEPVTAADVIDMHRFLEQFDGDFIGYFQTSEST